MKYLMRIAVLLVLFTWAIPTLAQEDKNAEIENLMEEWEELQMIIEEREYEI